MKIRHFPARLAWCGLLCGLACEAPAGTITIKGSEALLKLTQKWTETYTAAHTNTKFKVTGGGSGAGLAALQKKGADLAQTSRRIKPAETAAFVQAFGRRPAEYMVALDALAVYVNADNPVKHLTVEQLGKIFTGKVRNWKEVGGSNAPITMYGRESTSSTYEFVKEQVLKGKDFAPSVQSLQGSTALLQAVAKDKSGIGYGGVAGGTGIRHLGIKRDENAPAIEPTEESVVKRAYPIWRYLYVYVNPQLDKGEIGAYLNWIRGDEGQKFAKEAGFFPLPKNLRE